MSRKYEKKMWREAQTYMESQAYVTVCTIYMEISFYLEKF